jgi:hypothetical protein
MRSLLGGSQVVGLSLFLDIEQRWYHRREWNEFEIIGRACRCVAIEDERIT